MSFLKNPIVHHIPIVTTFVALGFFLVLLQAARTRRSGPHLYWWAFGALCYGMGTACEASVTLFGNSIFLTKSWYVTGALLGGWPLAQGSVFLLQSRKFATRSAIVTSVFVALAAFFVFLSPVHTELLEPTRPTGHILAWTWVRFLTPVINLYAVVFLIGGAAVSALRYRRARGEAEKFWGNVWIAVGALMPGIGGSLAKAGLVEALYILEFVGLVLIWAGYAAIQAAKESTVGVPAAA